MIKSTKIIYVLVICSLLFVFATGCIGSDNPKASGSNPSPDIRESTDLPLDDNEILELVETNTPSIDPTEFEKMKSDKNTLAVYGELPEKSGVESYDWHLLLLTISKDVQKDSDFQKYGYVYGGSVIGYGATYTGGYMKVNIDFERADLLKQEDLDQIQKIFEKHANENGVKNLPLVIGCENKGVFAIGDSEIVPIAQ